MREAGLVIVTGGQTGVDRAALDTAIAWGIPVGGWCPAGRRAEDGPISVQYPLTETPSGAYLQRTLWNVRGSDGLLILGSPAVSPGTDAAAQKACALKRPVMCAALHGAESAAAVAGWLKDNRILRLNVAGPRESEAPGVYRRACAFLDSLFSQLSAQAGIE